MALTITATSGFVHSGTTITLNKPTGTVSGDTLLIFASGSSSVSTNPSGFGAPAQTSSNTGCDLWVKTAGGSEPSTYSIVYTTNENAVAVCVRISGAAATWNDPSTLPAIFDPSSAATTSIAVPGVTLANSGDTLLWIGAAGQNAVPGTVTIPSGYTSLISSFTSGSSGTDMSMAVGTKSGVSSGATGTQTGTSSVSEFPSGYLIGLVPASGGTAWNIDVSDTITATTTATLTKAAPLDVSDTITATATAGLALGAGIAVSDTVTASITAGISKATNWLIDVSQTITAGRTVDVAKNAAAPVNSWSGGEALGKGLITVPVNNNTGNTLVAFIGWDATMLARNPIPNVADSAHNWWVPLATSSKSGNYRGSIWIAPAADAADYISISTTLPPNALNFKIYEFSGLPFLAELSGMEASGFLNTSATSITVSGTPSAASYGFALLVSGAPGAQTLPSSPWATLTPPADVGGIHLTPMLGASVSGAQSLTFTDTNASNLAAVLCGIHQSPTVPSQPNANWPAVKVEAAFGYLPGNLTDMPVWTDITALAKQPGGETTLKSSRGRQYEITSPEAGELTIEMDNHTGQLTPGYSGSPYFPNVLPQVPVRVSAYWNQKIKGVGFGNVNQYPQMWPDPQWGFSELSASDGIGVLSNITLRSAYRSQVLIDNPYAFWPCDESYTEAQGLPFGNIAGSDALPLLGIDGNSNTTTATNTGMIIPLATGQQLAMNGDQGGGIGISGESAIPNAWSAGAVCFDPGLPQPSPGMTVEFWGVFDTNTTLNNANATKDYEYPLISLYGYPGNYGTRSLGPVRCQLVIHWVHGNTTADALVYLSDISGNLSVLTFTGAIPTDGLPHYYALQFSETGGNYHAQLFVDGPNSAGSGSSSGVSVASDIRGIVVGPATNFYDNTLLWSAFEYTIGQVAVYAFGLNSQQMTNHYLVGANGGFGNDDAVTRFAWLMSWGQSGVPKAASPTSATPLMGAADSLETQPVTSAMDDVTGSEGGFYYADALGNATYWSRQYLYNNTPKWTFGDNPAGGEVPYDPGQEFDFDITYLYNEVSGQRQIAQNQETVNTALGAVTQAVVVDGVQTVVVDAASRAQYLRRNGLSMTFYTTSDEDVYDGINWNLAKYKQAAYRIPTIVLSPGTNPNVWPAALGVEQGDIVKVIRRPVGGPSYTVVGVVQRVEHDAGPDHWEVTLSISPYSIEANVLQIGQAGFDTLGSNGVGW